MGCFHDIVDTPRNWQNVKEKIESVLLTIKTDPLIDSLVKTSLSSIPGIGLFLSVIYDNSIDPPNEKSKQVTLLLEHLQKLSEREFENLYGMIIDNEMQLIENTKSVESLIQKIDIFSGYFLIIEKNQLEEILLSSQTLEKIKDLEKSITDRFNNTLRDTRIVTLSIEKYDYPIPSERLLFYLSLMENLHMSKVVYTSHLVIRNELYYLLLKKYQQKIYDFHEKNKDSEIGYDEIFYYFHNNMDQYQLSLFDFLRKNTEDTKKFNLYTASLIKNNPKFVQELPELKQLLDHLSIWQCRYEIFKDDPHMCLIYVGPKLEKQYPKLIDHHIQKIIDDLRTDLDLREFWW